MSGQPWDASYQGGPAPWDVAGPQPAIVRVASEFRGTVLDVGCGTGEHTLYVASLGLPVLGVDVAETAIAIANRNAAGHAIQADFGLADALHLERLGHTFDTVLDCGLFHAFDNSERQRYATSLASATEPGAQVYVLCFADEGPDQGPHPVSRRDIEGAFYAWTVEFIKSERIRTRFHNQQGAPAWLAKINRV